MALRQLLLIHLLKGVVTLVNDNHGIGGAKRLHERQVFTPEGQFNVDCVLFVLDGQGDVGDFDHVDVVVLLVCVFRV
jgi:hypothetical protein